MTAPAAPVLVTPVPCERCDGTGFVQARVEYYGVPGLCFKCAGSCVQEGDPAQITANRAADKASQADAVACQQVRWSAFEILGALPREEFNLARDGVMTLEYLEPERLMNALRSVVSRHPQAIPALVEYFKTNAHRLPQNSGAK